MLGDHQVYGQSIAAGTWAASLQCALFCSFSIDGLLREAEPMLNISIGQSSCPVHCVELLGDDRGCMLQKDKKIRPRMPEPSYSGTPIIRPLVLQ